MGLLHSGCRYNRSHLSICPSAQQDVNVKALIYEFLDNKFYKHDYESITRTLISDHVTYEQTAQRLREIADMLF